MLKAQAPGKTDDKNCRPIEPGKIIQKLLENVVLFGILDEGNTYQRKACRLCGFSVNGGNCGAAVSREKCVQRLPFIRKKRKAAAVP